MKLKTLISAFFLASSPLLASCKDSEDEHGKVFELIETPRPYGFIQKTNGANDASRIELRIIDGIAYLKQNKGNINFYDKNKWKLHGYAMPGE